MIVEIYTKNFALSSTVEVPDGAVPRAGETVTLEQDGGYLQGATELLVHDVTYVLKNNKLTAQIKCHASSGPDNRRVILKENGWL